MTSEASQMGLASGDGLGRKSLRIHVAKSSLHVDDKMPVVILGAGSGRYRVWNGIPDFKEFRQWLMRTEETNRSNEGHDLCVVGKDNKLLSTCPTGTDAVPNGSQSNAFSSGLVPQPTKQKVDSFQSDSGITIQVPGVRFIEPAEQIAHANQKDHLVRLSSSTYIRFNQPSAAELYVAVEYDMDEEDDAWLAAFNKSCNGELLTEDDLELLIDRMEKQYFRELCAMGKPAIQAAKAGALAPSKVSTCSNLHLFAYEYCDECGSEN